MNRPDIGEWTVTTIKHEYLETGTTVKVIGFNFPFGYDVEDKNGNRIYEIGWEI